VVGWGWREETPRSIEKFRGLSRAQPEKDRGTSRCFEVISFFQLEFIFSRISVSDWKLKTENWKWKLAIFNLERSLKPVFFLGFSKNLKSSRSISIREAQARSLISMLLYDFRFFLETVEKTPGLYWPGKKNFNLKFYFPSWTFIFPPWSFISLFKAITSISMLL